MISSKKKKGNWVAFHIEDKIIISSHTNAQIETCMISHKDVLALIILNLLLKLESPIPASVFPASLDTTTNTEQSSFKSCGWIMSAKSDLQLYHIY